MKVTIPTLEQVIGENALQIFKLFGTRAAPTDLAALQYCWVFPQDKTTEKKRSGTYYIHLDNPSNLMDAPVISSTGERGYLYLSNQQGGVRPLIPASETAYLTPTSVRKLGIRGKGSVQIATFGEYPQKIADSKTQKQLNTLFFAGLKLRNYSYARNSHTVTFSASFQEGSYTAHDSPLRRIHRKFTMNDRVPNSYDVSPLPRTYPVYRLEDKKYIQFFPHKTGDNIILPDGNQISHPKTHIWLEVTPLEWIVDPSGSWVAKDIVLSNIKMEDKPFQQRTGLFEKSSLYAFLNDTFAKEILPPVRIARKRKTLRTNTSRERG